MSSEEAIDHTLCPHCADEGSEVTTTVRDVYHCPNDDCPVSSFYGGTADRLLPAAVSAAYTLGGEADELEAREDHEEDEHLQDVASGLRFREMNLKEALEALGYSV